MQEKTNTLKRFQFLIGWLQTGLFSAVKQPVIDMFQFLIGWLQTKVPQSSLYRLLQGFNSLQVGYKPELTPKYRRLLEGFNSLQVGYKPFKHCRAFLECTVSIPYRLATNQKLSQRAVNKLVVSIPYRLATNLPIFPRILLVFKKFQFLIGWLQTVPAFFNFKLSIQGFNSLQVGYKLI